MKLMLNRIKFGLLGLFAAFSLALVVAPVGVSALDCDFDGDGSVSAKESIQCGACEAGTEDCATDPGAQANETLTETISDVINVLSIIVAIISVIMIIVAGAKFVASGGNEQTVKSARSTLVFALIGLVVAALAQILVHFVLNRIVAGNSSPPAPTNQRPGGGPGERPN